MFTIGLWLAGAALTVAGAFKMKKVVKALKQAKEVYDAYQSAIKADSESGVEISAKEWRKIAEESLDVLEILASVLFVYLGSRNK